MNQELHYREAYLFFFNQVTDVISLLEQNKTTVDTAIRMLKHAQSGAEELAIEEFEDDKKGRP